MALAEAGAGVVLTARRGAELETTAQEFRQRGFDCLSLLCDIAVDADTRNVVEETVRRYGRLDILVNNAGVSWGAPYEEMTSDAWRRVLETNVIGTHQMTRAALPLMRRQAYGKIVNVASVMGLIGVPKSILEAAAYTASKGAIIALTRQLAVQYAPEGIRVNAVAPGFFSTRLTKEVVGRAESQISALTPLGRVGQEGEFRGAVLFLAAEASDYVTGQVLAVDGGMTAG